MRVTLVSKHTGTVIECGAAEKDANGGWVYKNTVAVEDAKGVTVQIEGSAII